MAKATLDVGVIRFHGRNTAVWEKKGVTLAERFNYLYSDEELREWVPRIKELAGRTKQLHVLFNNCYRDQAVVNTGQIRLMLD